MIIYDSVNLEDDGRVKLICLEDYGIVKIVSENENILVKIYERTS